MLETEGSWTVAWKDQAKGLRKRCKSQARVGLVVSLAN
jgi:hypothetical protein